MLIPNNNYWAHYGGDEAKLEVKPEYKSNRSVGGSYLFNRVLRQLRLPEMLDECLGEKRSALVQTAALHMVARGNVFENVLGYCEEYTLDESPLTTQTSSELFSKISYDERMEFFRRWLASQSLGSFLAYDSTSFSTYSKGIIKREYGFNKDGDRLPQINFGCYFSQSAKLPVFYVTYPGSIVDKSHLRFMMAYNEDLGIKDVGFVMDRGYCSTANLLFMAKHNLDYVMGVDIVHKTTRRAVEALRSNKLSYSDKVAKGVFAKSARGCYYGVQGTMHVFYEPDLASSHLSELDRLIKSKEEKLAQLSHLTAKDATPYRKYFVINLEKDGKFTYSYDYNKIDALISNFGYFCILTNSNMDSSEVLDVYRRKDVIEKGFDDLKNSIEMKRLRTHTDETTEGKMFCAFIALIVVSQIGVKLEDFLEKKSWSKEHVVAEMEKIRIISGVAGKRLADPLTKTQRMIIEHFGLDAEDVEAYIRGETQDLV
jgi:transposase